ncbi:zinc finger domain-containing protein [Streptomyces sp. NBC_01727]|uniref:zinc finger domain-containing protein n=1 Tax=Streptomyces sp. NBC_01727 TaxID=2975924 RepID=UPI002E119476|nr:hypothetical protein OIE76_42470 [Streptomyces sp. NBC_01727]
MASADHLYVKSAATAWLRDRDEQAVFDFARPDGASIGSVVDIRFKRAGLRVHLDQTVAPAWDEDGREPVLGVSVPVDRDTLIRRWYVHRIRLDSEGTTRRVSIGTEAFARATEWFGLDECEMTERGLSTPAIEQIVRSRSTPPPPRRPAGKPKRVPDAEARAQVLLRRLTDARKVESVVVVKRACGEIAALDGLDQETQVQIAVALEGAHRWLEGQVEVRRDLFSRLSKAVATRNNTQVRQLLVRVNATAGHDRSEAEDGIAGAAGDYIAALGRENQNRPAKARARRARENGSEAAATRVRNVLSNLRRRGDSLSAAEVRKLVKMLTRAAAQAGDCVSADETMQIARWTTRGAGRNSPAAPGPMATLRAEADGDRRPETKRPRHDQVARRFWIKKTCPRCLAAAGKNCVNGGRTGTGEVRKTPHDERLRLIVDERKLKAQKHKENPPRQPSDVTCPDCDKAPGTQCATPSGGPHRSRVERAQRFARSVSRSGGERESR